jgi:hypothetical protein
VRTRSRLTTAAAVLVLTVAGAAAPAAAATGSYQFSLLAKAKPDECFNGIGQPYPAGPPCAEGQAKVNQAYVWGLTRVSDDVWFGTGTNNQCLTSGATLQVIKPVLNADYVCEYGESQIVKADPTIPAAIGDMRPPQVWLYDARKHRSYDESGQIRAKSADDAERLRTTIGLRAAGSYGGVVLLSGPTVDEELNMFAFDDRTKKFLGSVTMPDYGNVRTFLQTGRALYVGVGTGRNGSTGGAVLRWTGSVHSPFEWETVASLPVQAADLSVYGNRIAATSWPAEGSANTTDKLGGVWVSPVMGSDGLTPDDATGWTQVWNVRQYEPDKVVAATYGLGGVASYGGYLYWGTMHVPMKATKVFQKLYPQTDQAAAQAQVKNTQRAIAIFRGKDLGTPNQKIELLYGATQLPVYTPATNSWAVASTGMTPLYGKSGFGQPYNNYTWRMAVTDGKLFVGTMDWSYLIHDIVNQSSSTDTTLAQQQAIANPADVPAPDPTQFGGDLWMFSSTTAPATAVNTTGMGNYLNYGIRNMIVNGDGLYLGMANPMNLRTDPTDDIPEGGWELVGMTKPCR